MNSATAPTSGTPVERVSISIAPHCSLNRRQAAWFLFSVSLPCLLVASILALRGYWPVLPFAGAELLLLTWALHRSLARRRHIEIITVTDTQVLIERLGRRQTERFEFPRHWAQVKLRHSDVPGYFSRLTLESHGHCYEVGAFLTEAERLGLTRRLRLLVGRMAESPPLATGAGKP